MTGLTISADPTPISSASFNVLTAATYEIYGTHVPTTMQQGTTAILNVTVRNIGAKDGSTDVKFYVNDTLKETKNLFVQKASGTNTTQFAWNAAGVQPGNYLIKILAGNDEFTATVNVVQATCSDNINCADNEICNLSNQCEQLLCPPNQTAFNHTCIDCTKFDLDGNHNVDIFDVVAGLEYLSEGKQIFNEGCTARNQYKIDLFDLLILIDKI